MPETLTKLRPNRDLQCYFQQPSAIAALSDTSPTGFTVSGCWRQQFDWAVVEWNRDNVIEHPALRNLPDGDLSGVTLSYEETRTNCIPSDSSSYDSIGWSSLRIWEWSGGREHFHTVPLRTYATPVDGEYVPATLTFELQGLLTVGDYVELAWMDQHANYCVTKDDTLETAIAGLAGFINAKGDGCGIRAEANAAQIKLTCTAAAGENGNRIGVYGGIHGSGTESWSPSSGYFSGGSSPKKWQFHLDFGNLFDTNQQPVNTTNVRKLRWTWAADWQPADFNRSEFSVKIENWQVTGTGLGYQVAGPGSRRIEDDSAAVIYSGDWTTERGNYSGGSIAHTKTLGATIKCTYVADADHLLLLGTRYTDQGGTIEVQVDEEPTIGFDLKRATEDVLVRLPIGQLTGRTAHTISVSHSGPDDSDVYFDFFEIAIPSNDLPDFDNSSTSTLATDWDTYHSLAIAPERTAWEIVKLGFFGRVNHYAGAMWFYELVSAGNAYATASIQFSGAPPFGGTTELTVGGTVIQHLNLISDTAETIAKCFELLLTAGSSAVWAQANGATLTITSRTPGAAGNLISVGAETNSEDFTASISGANLNGGVDGRWTTDLAAVPRINRAARDWSRSFFRAMNGYGVDATASFSMELRHGDDSATTGVAQRYPQGPVWLNTPALQTNFGPASLQFWEQVYSDMADVMADAGVRPYLQFGEVQWWYFADSSGMPFYDEYTMSRFQAAYGRPLAIIASQNADPSSYPEECAFLPTLIGEFTNAVMAFVRQKHSDARFEVLYPPDTNDTPLNRIINYPAKDWTPSALNCLKTENFTYTGDRNLDKVRLSIDLPTEAGFAPNQRSHLVGIGDPTSPWLKEQDLALGAGVESVVLFALDQFCLVGYDLPLRKSDRRSGFMGA